MAKVVLSAGIAVSVLLVTAASISQELLDPAVVGAGVAIYGQRCASCHGLVGAGAPGWQQPNAQGELPPPPHDQTGHTWRHADGALYRIVAEGWRDPFNRTDRLTMPAFAEILSPAEIISVITFLKALWTPEQRQLQLEQSRDNPFPPVPR